MKQGLSIFFSLFFIIRGIMYLNSGRQFGWILIIAGLGGLIFKLFNPGVYETEEEEEEEITLTERQKELIVAYSLLEEDDFNEMIKIKDTLDKEEQEVLYAEMNRRFSES